MSMKRILNSLKPFHRMIISRWHSLGMRIDWQWHRNSISCSEEEEVEALSSWMWFWIKAINVGNRNPARVLWPGWPPPPFRDDKRREMCNEWERIGHITSLDSSIVGVWEGERVYNTFYPYRALSTADSIINLAFIHVNKNSSAVNLKMIFNKIHRAPAWKCTSQRVEE